MKKYTLMWVVAILLTTGSAYGQDVKLAFVDFQRIQAEYPDFQLAQAEFDKEVEAWKTELAEKEQNILTMQANYEKQKLLLSEDKRIEREAEINDERFQYQQMSTNILGPGGRADASQKALLEEVLQKVNDAMALVASKDNYSVIFEKAALAYAQEKLDVTDKVLQELERMQ